eukprot:8244294-Ditylum_brightwellii.AAC.1
MGEFDDNYDYPDDIPIHQNEKNELIIGGPSSLGHPPAPTPAKNAAVNVVKVPPYFRHLRPERVMMEVEYHTTNNGQWSE